MLPYSINCITQDFERDVHCLFGLPVDNLSLEAVKVFLRKRITEDGNTIVSTINVNWVVQTFFDPDFHAAVLNSDLVTLDGKPLLWLAKLLRCPMRQTVPGSTLIQELLKEQSDHPLTIFLFGGEARVGELAMEKINQRRGGLRAVGALNPGYGTVDEMSNDATIAIINEARPDILLVALGAKKGTQWIERNRYRLRAKIISHLGATINFLAGTINRAPHLIQQIGLEWAWRIAQEPKLFFRYTADGVKLLRFSLPRLSLCLHYLYLRHQYSRMLVEDDPCVREYANEIVLSFGRNLNSTNYSTLRNVFSKCLISEKKIFFDFEKTEFINSRYLGLLLILISKYNTPEQKIKIINYGKIFKIFRLFGFSNSLLLKEP